MEPMNDILKFDSHQEFDKIYLFKRNLCHQIREKNFKIFD